MDTIKYMRDASKKIAKEGLKDIATKVVPIVASGAAAILVNILNDKEDDKDNNKENN